VVRWPGPILAAASALALVGLLALPGAKINYNERRYMPKNIAAMQGFDAADRHFSQARMNPEVLMVQTDQPAIDARLHAKTDGPNAAHGRSDEHHDRNHGKHDQHHERDDRHHAQPCRRDEDHGGRNERTTRAHLRFRRFLPAGPQLFLLGEALFRHSGVLGAAIGVRHPGRR
jgi:hypothetical protein